MTEKTVSPDAGGDQDGSGQSTITVKVREDLNEANKFISSARESLNMLRVMLASVCEEISCTPEGILADSINGGLIGVSGSLSLAGDCLEDMALSIMTWEGGEK